MSKETGAKPSRQKIPSEIDSEETGAPGDENPLGIRHMIAGPCCSVLRLPSWCSRSAPARFCGLWITRSLDTPRRIVVLLGIGMAATAVLIDVLGRLQWLGAFPYVARWRWRRCRSLMWRRTVWHSADAGRARRNDAWTARDLAACAVIVALAAGTSYLVFAHRVTEDAE